MQQATSKGSPSAGDQSHIEHIANCTAFHHCPSRNSSRSRRPRLKRSPHPAPFPHRRPAGAMACSLMGRVALRGLRPALVVVGLRQAHSCQPLPSLRAAIAATIAANQLAPRRQLQPQRRPAAAAAAADAATDAAPAAAPAGQVCNWRGMNGAVHEREASSCRNMVVLPAPPQPVHTLRPPCRRRPHRTARRAAAASARRAGGAWWTSTPLAAPETSSQRWVGAKRWG